MSHARSLASRWVAAVAALVLVGACEAGPTATPTASPSPAAEPCLGDELAQSGFRGVVVDSEGEPVADILVQIDNTAGFGGSARTGEDGVFFADGVVGTFILTTVDIDYPSVTDAIVVPCGETVELELVLPPPE